MKSHPAPLIVMLLVLLDITTAAFAQTLPASVADSSSILERIASVETGPKLLIVGNSLAQAHSAAFDLSAIPAAPDSVIRDPKPSPITLTKAENTASSDADSDSDPSPIQRSMALMGVLAIACFAIRKRPDPPVRADMPEMRNFPKKRLAHHQAHA